MKLLGLATIMTCLMLAGCDDPARNLYNGIRNNNEAHRTPEQREMQPAPTYDEYTTERKRIENDEQ